MNNHKRIKSSLLHGQNGSDPSGMGKLPPQAQELEDAVLGAVLLEDESYHRVAEMLVPEIFYRERNGIICQAIVNLKNKGEKADILTVTQELKVMGQLETVGGAYYVSKLTNRVASGGNIEAHMRIVQQMYILRAAIMSSTNLIRSAYDEGADAFDVLDEYEKNLTAITAQLFITKLSTSASLFSKVIEQNNLITSSPSAVIGVPSGFTDLDSLTGGFRKTDLIILAARPGMGKTAMAGQIAKNAATHYGKPTAVFSLEQSELQLFQRMCSQETEIPLDKFTTTGLDEDDQRLLLRDSEKLRSAPIYVDDTGGQSIFDIRNKSRKLKREQKIELIVIDYLQLVTVGHEKQGSREQEVSLISRSLKNLAKELEIPVIAISQLSRETEKGGKDNIPRLSHLRDSGSIEQDADMVMFIYRPEYYGLTHDGDGNSTKGVARVIIAKNRSGPLMDVDMKWKAECTMFRDFYAPENVSLPIIHSNIDDNLNFLEQ